MSPAHSSASLLFVVIAARLVKRAYEARNEIRTADQRVRQLKE